MDLNELKRSFEFAVNNCLETDRRSGCKKLEPDAFFRLCAEYLEVPYISSRHLGFNKDSSIKTLTFQSADTGRKLRIKQFGVRRKVFTHSITVVDGSVIDLATGVNGMSLLEYLRVLFNRNGNKNIKLIKDFCEYEPKEHPKYITLGMYDKLMSEEGLSFNDFITLYRGVRRAYNQNLYNTWKVMSQVEVLKEVENIVRSQFPPFCLKISGFLMKADGSAYVTMDIMGISAVSCTYYLDCSIPRCEMISKSSKVKFEDVKGKFSFQ